VVAATATFSAMLLTVRERRHDLATLKALGMTPRQLVAMVATTAALLGLIGGVIGIPAGLAMTRALGSAMASQAGNDLPPAATNAVSAWMMPLFLLSGMAVAILGSLLAARSAARTSVATVLHGE
jgi:putative ABC transport system permease protein